MTLDNLVRDLTKVHPIPKSSVRALIQAYVEGVVEQHINPHIDVCQEKDGLPFCKNCGLERYEPCRCRTPGHDDGDTTCWKHHRCEDGECTHGE